ncbi:MAG: type II 3-dehydroquinate dehydratase [Actinomycetota bacterium]|nr:MAG: type II 3-dehydroquinate dehydratase [Actinomycetota bacterium]
MERILIINGPNLNMLGQRDPAIYGSETLSDIEHMLSSVALELGIELEFFQSNYEGALIEKVHSARGSFVGIVINPGAFTHYSYALKDAFDSVKIPFVEIHISNIHARETFRHTSVLASDAIGQIAGLGTYGYELALRALVRNVIGR